MVKWTNADGQTKRANERSFVYRPPAWRRWRNVKTTYNGRGGFAWKRVLFSAFRYVKEGLNGVNHQPSKRPRNDHESSTVQKRFLFTVNCQKGRLILTVRKFQGILNLTISAVIHRLLVSEESLAWKNQFPCSQKPLFLDIRRPYNLLLYMKYFEISYMWKAKTNFKTQQLILIN